MLDNPRHPLPQGHTMSPHRTRLLFAGLALALLQGCGVMTVAGAAAGAAISVTGAVVGTSVKVTGKVIEKTVDVLTPGSSDKADEAR